MAKKFLIHLNDLWNGVQNKIKVHTHAAMAWMHRIALITCLMNHLWNINYYDGAHIIPANRGIGCGKQPISSVKNSIASVSKSNNFGVAAQQSHNLIFYSFTALRLDFKCLAIRQTKISTTHAHISRPRKWKKNSKYKAINEKKWIQ